MKSSGYFISVVFGTVLICSMIKIMLGFYIIYFADTVKKGEYWLYPLIVVKKHLAENASKRVEPKLFVVSGSNSLFGIDNQELEKTTGMPVVNMSLHAALPLEYLVYNTLPYIKKGDVVVMPLEWTYYSMTKLKSDWMLENMLYWDKPFIQQLPYQIQQEWAWFANWKLYQHNLFPKKKLKVLHTSQQIIDSWKKQAEPEHGMYHYLLLNLDGSYKVQELEVNPPKSFNYLAELPKEKFLQNVANIRKQFEEKGATVIFTYPSMIKSDIFNMDNKETVKRLEKTQQLLAQYDIRLIGNIQDFMYDSSAFLDTNYHLSPKVATIHSRKLGRMLKKHISPM